MAELRAAIVNQSNIMSVLFPEQTREGSIGLLGKAQSLVPREFLLSKGAEGKEQR